MEEERGLVLAIATSVAFVNIEPPRWEQTMKIGHDPISCHLRHDRRRGDRR